MKGRLSSLLATDSFGSLSHFKIAKEPCSISNESVTYSYRLRRMMVALYVDNFTITRMIFMN